MKAKILNDIELARLAKVIGEMEGQTSGEIRVVIARRSSTFGHVLPLLWSLLLAASFLLIWFGRHEWVFWERWWMWPVIFVITYIFAAALTRLASVQRGMTPSNDLKQQVWTRAELEFHREGLTRTRSGTGILLFVSLLERQAVVLADKGIASKAPAQAWDKVVELIVHGARTGRWAEQMELAIRACGAYLGQHFPPEPGDTNELSNQVIIKD